MNARKTGKAKHKIMVGYGRVSTDRQSTKIQEQQLKDAGCQIIRTEKKSGTNREGREELSKLLELLGSEHMLVVTRMDRLGRNLRDVLNIVHDLEEHGISLWILDHDIKTDTPTGKIFLQLTGMFSEFEANIRRERAKLGIEKAKKEAPWKYSGRKPSIDREAVFQLRTKGMTQQQIANRLNCTRMTIYRILKEAEKQSGVTA